MLPEEQKDMEAGEGPIVGGLLLDFMIGTFLLSVPGTKNDHDLSPSCIHLHSPSGHSVKTMAAEEEWTCPICRDVQKDIAYAVPCRHEFCLGCILRWAMQKETCPLCRNIMTVVKVAAWDDEDDLDFTISPPAPPLPACFQNVIQHESIKTGPHKQLCERYSNCQ
uniref:RING-type domain-containing protein n=1 Tax=Gallus gallus TaxID=9031 RepID=A0A8V0YHH5_CHICK